MRVLLCFLIGHKFRDEFKGQEVRDGVLWNVAKAMERRTCARCGTPNPETQPACIPQRDDYKSAASHGVRKPSELPPPPPKNDPSNRSSE